MDLDASDRRAARLDGAIDIVWRDAVAGNTHAANPLGQLARGAARHVAGTLLAIREATRRVGVTRGLDTLLFGASPDRP